MLIIYIGQLKSINFLEKKKYFYGDYLTLKICTSLNLDLNVGMNY